MFKTPIIKISRSRSTDMRKLGVAQIFSFISLRASLFVFTPFLLSILYKTESRFWDISKLTFHKSANGKNTWGVCHDSFSIS
jgi:hypothetical protein